MKKRFGDERRTEIQSVTGEVDIDAHSQPKDNVNDLGVSIGVFKEPVQFSNFHKAKIIIVMSAKDQEKHLRVLKDIMGVFSVEKNVEKLEMAENPDEILDSLKLLIK